MNSHPAFLIGVVVVNWNRWEMLRECLQSLAAQTQKNFRVVVVDNGSTDGSVEMIRREFGEGSAMPVQVVENDRNRGFCEANNQGIAAVGGDFVALLNNDAVADPNWLFAMYEAIRNRPEIGMIASKILVYEDPSKIDKVGHLIYPDGQNRGRGAGERDQGQYDRFEEVAWPDGCAALYRRSMLDQIGGFDEDLFAYADDAELGLRARIAGWGCLYAPQAVVRHHRGATLGVGSSRRLELIERNRILLVAKLFPWSMALVSPFYYAIRLLAGAGAAARSRGETVRYPGWRGKLVMAGALIRGDLAALAMLPKFLAKRREVRRFRKLSPAEVRALLRRFRIPLRTLNERAI